MKTVCLLLASFFCVLPLRAQHADSPARATPASPRTTSPAARGAVPGDNPASANALRRTAPGNGDNGQRGPRGPEDWLGVETLSPDGRLFVARNLDRQTRVWDLANGKPAVELPPGVITTVFSPDSRTVACQLEKLSDGKTPRRWQAFAAADARPLGDVLQVPEGQGDGPGLVFFSPDGKLLAGFTGAGNEINVALWDAASGKLLAAQSAREIYGGNVTAFSADGKTLVTAGSGDGVGLWSVPDLKRLKTVALDHKVIDAAAFSPDGKLLAVGGEEQRTVKGRQDGYPVAWLYEVATGRLVAQLPVAPERGERVRQVVFADGGRAVVTADDKSVQAWSTADGKRLANLPDAGYPVAVSADGRLLAGSVFPDLYCWDTSTWRLGLKIPDARPGYGTGTGRLGYVPLTFTPDGGAVVTVTGNSAAAWEWPGGLLKAERKATQSQVVY